MNTAYRTVENQKCKIAALTALIKCKLLNESRLPRVALSSRKFESSDKIFPNLKWQTDRSMQETIYPLYAKCSNTTSFHMVKMKVRWCLVIPYSHLFMSHIRRPTIKTCI